MKDITFCSPTRLRKKCSTCYRRKFFPNERQSWSNFYDQCKDYYIKVVSPTEYSKRIDKIIAKKGAVHETLIALLNEASKYTITPSDKIITKKGSRGQKASKATKRVRK